jgi:hypothetical protein
MQIIDDWLEDWVSARAIQSGHERTSTAALAETLCRDAEADGYDSAFLADACGGNIHEFLERQGDMASSPPPMPLLRNPN